MAELSAVNPTRGNDHRDPRDSGPYPSRPPRKPIARGRLLIDGKWLDAETGEIVDARTLPLPFVDQPSLSIMTKTGEIVYVIDDDPGVRHALSEALDAFGFTSSCFSNGSDFLESERRDATSCILLDMKLPDIDGLDLQDILAERTSPPIVFMSEFADIPSTVRAMKKGAIEFLTKPIDLDALLMAVREGLAKDSEMRMRRAEIDRIEERFNSLTLREREVFSLVVGGMLNKQSAHVLGITEATLGVHRGQIMRKMKAQSFAELVRMSSKLNVVDEKGKGRRISGSRLETESRSELAS